MEDQRLTDALWTYETEQRRRGVHPSQLEHFEPRRADGKPMTYARSEKAVTELETIYAWTAKRAGGRITITGKTREGNLRKVVGVDYITTGVRGDTPYVVAVVDHTTPEARYVLA